MQMTAGFARPVFAYKGLKLNRFCLTGLDKSFTVLISSDKGKQIVKSLCIQLGKHFESSRLYIRKHTHGTKPF